MDLLAGLNPEQLAAVEYKDGPLLIVAGAGTGKTTVISQRIAYLIERGKARPEEILALTFTEKAAGEMADRVESLLPLGYFDLWISTFHSFSERILKEHGLAIGLSTDFKLLNEFEQWALIKKNLAKFELDYYRPLGNPTKFIRALLKHFSRAKDENISPADYLEYASGLKQDLDMMLGGRRQNEAPLKRGGRGVSAKGEGQNLLNPVRLPSALRLRLEESAHDEAPLQGGQDKVMAKQEIGRINEVANAYHVYGQLLLDNNALDFGDLINYSLKLFRERPAILEKYRGQFKYILLDEFQDTNWAQYELVKILAGSTANLTVVGDDDQSIFRFRGASMSNILQFAKDYPGAKKIILTRNYRSRQNLLDLSYEFIKQNNPNRLEWQLEKIPSPLTRGEEGGLSDGRTPSNSSASAPARRDGPLTGGGQGKLNKKLIAENNGQGEIEVLQSADLAGEVEQVADKIGELKLKDRAASWNDFAILVRANDSANVFMDELDRRGWPYIFGARRGLYAKPIIMDAIAYFKLLDNYHESVSLWRILNLPVYNFTFAELADFNQLARKKAWSLFEVLNRADVFKFSADLQKKITPLLALIAKHSALAREKAASEVLLAFMNESGYLKYLTSSPSATRANSATGGAGQANKTDRRPGAEQLSEQFSEQKSLEAMNLLNQFLKRIRAFEAASDDKSVKAFLAELNLEREAGEEGSLAVDQEAGPEAIKILTVHAAKGLEFKYVFIANLVDKRFPTTLRSEQISLPDALVKEILPAGDAHLEEERRLFYVAMTRARVGLYFSWALDYGGQREKKPSRFLREVGLEKNDKNPPCKGGAGEVKKLNPLNPSASAPARRDGPFEGGQKFPSPLNVGVGNKIPLTPNVRGGNLPAHFSYSQLAAYSNCPYQYRFAHILKIPVAGKEQFSFGKTMHATLQKLFMLLNEKTGLAQAGLFEKPPLIPPCQGGEKIATPLTSGGGGGSISFTEILKLYEQSWIDDWYESKEKKQARKKQGQEILKVFYEKYKNNWPEVLFLEKGFNLKIACPASAQNSAQPSSPAGRGASGQDSYIVRGVIDRIDKVSGGLKIVDYKTGRAKEKLSFAEKEQLFIYQLAAAELFNQPIKALAFYYLDNNSEVEFIGETKDLEKIKAKIIFTIKEISRAEFPPRPSQLCAWCDYREICEYRA